MSGSREKEGKKGVRHGSSHGLNHDELSLMKMRKQLNTRSAKRSQSVGVQSLSPQLMKKDDEPDSSLIIGSIHEGVHENRVKSSSNPFIKATQSHL